jgi:hypothetical protein
MYVCGCMCVFMDTAIVVHIQIDRQTERHTDTQKQTDRQKDTQTYTDTDRHRERLQNTHLILHCWAKVLSLLVSIASRSSLVKSRKSPFVYPWPKIMWCTHGVNTVYIW